MRIGERPAIEQHTDQPETMRTTRRCIPCRPPLGRPEPSADDIALTRRLVSAGTLMGIEVIDHVIVGEAGRYVSLKERGVL